MIDLSATHNPYDFANPVSDADLFVGRLDELEEIRYYLDHAKTAPRPINLAVLGARASGKTSLLNMIDIEARKRDFCVVRIDLDEDDSKTQLGFFFKVFDGILGATCKRGGFGGTAGKTYDMYMDIVNAYDVPDDKTFCPFLFPLQYAKAMGSSNFSVPVSDHNFKEDLARIRTEMGHPILLLFDEGNVLANSRVLLEKLRNIFMNTPGFMLVLTGTPDLFPLMDEVFSPIVRQFKKINVREFKSRDETQECIEKPLKKIGIDDPEEIFDFETLRDVNEIHDLSGGRPYEIQLMCHMLFRRLQARQAKRMKLNLSVLEDVRRELETSQNISVRPVLTKIRNLAKKQLHALNLLCTCDGIATFEQVWQIEHTFRAESRWTKPSLQEELQHLLELGVLTLKEGKITFEGDDFDRIYVKYFATEQGVELRIQDMPLEVALYRRVQAAVHELDGVESFSSLFASPDEIEIVKLAVGLSEAATEVDLFSADPSLAHELYRVMIEYQGRPVLPLVCFKLAFPWSTIHTWHYATDPQDLGPLEACLEKLLSLKGRAEEVGAAVAAERIELPVAPLELLAQKVERTENEQLRHMIALRHEIRVYTEYIEKSNLNGAVLHGRLAYRYNPEPSSRINLGYLFLRIGELDKARNLLESALAAQSAAKELALPHYNLTILECMDGHLRKALFRLEECHRIIADVPPNERQCACLLVPKSTENGLAYEEIRQPDLLAAADEALSTVKKITANA